MKPATARSILACHVEDPNGDVPPLMKSALRALEKSPELKANYVKQSLIDSHLRAAFKDASVPEDALASFASQVDAIPTRHFNPRDPAIIAVMIGFVLLVLVVTWNFLGRPASFPPDGLEVAEAALDADDSIFQPATVPAEELEDWFVLKGFDGFRTPSFFLEKKAHSAGLLEFEKQRLAIVRFPSLNAQLVVFNAAPLDITMPDGEWRKAQLNQQFSVAISQEKDMCFLVIVEGSEADLTRVLNSKGN